MDGLEKSEENAKERSKAIPSDIEELLRSIVELVQEDMVKIIEHTIKNYGQYVEDSMEAHSCLHILISKEKSEELKSTCATFVFATLCAMLGFRNEGASILRSVIERVTEHTCGDKRRIPKDLYIPFRTLYDELSAIVHGKRNIGFEEYCKFSLRVVDVCGAVLLRKRGEYLLPNLNIEEVERFHSAIKSLNLDLVKKELKDLPVKCPYCKNYFFIEDPFAKEVICAVCKRKLIFSPGIYKRER